ncbi:MAG: tetratricopeptide repeat protein, partial [Blastocatellia bacterium]|nr:tetratricopeptide repeat protein [Blastocatellia bacterium]
NIITIKCLEKDPSLRYDSAQALALDLQHYLDGDPISTRAQTWPSKLLKKARKHRALVTVSSVALALVLLTGAFSLWSWWQLSKQAELTRQMGEQAEKIESLMRFASLTQPHDIRAERQMALAELELIRRRMQEAGRLGEGPGNYALGRGYLAFSDFEQARTHLERAYTVGFRTPGLDLALGKVLGEFYRREADSVSQIEDKEGREVQMKRLETEYTVPIQRHLSAYLQAQPQGATQESVYLEGLVALYRKNYDLAVKKSLAAGGQSSWFYEAKCLEGETYLTWCREKLGSGEHEAARSLLAKAKTAFEAAVLMGPSNLQALFGLARSETLNLDLVLNLEKLTQEPCNRALAACDKVLQLDPEYSQGLFLKSVVYFRMASFQQKEGEDPRPTLALAIEWSKHAQAVNPTESEAYQTMGSSYRLAGRYELDHGIDPRPSFDLAVASLRKAVQFKPTAHGPYNTMGLIFRSRGQYELEHGNNPFPDFDEAAVNFKKAIQLNPNYSNAYTNLGFLYRSRGDYERETGLDPRTSFEQAAASLEKAIELNPNYPYADTHLGILRRVQGEYEWEHGRDPNPSFALAAAAFQKAIQTNKNYAFAHSNLGTLELLRGEYAEQSGTDPNPSFDRAEKSLNRALELNPKYNSAHQNLGMLELWRGLNTSNLGVDPLPFFAKATTHVQDALELNPKESESYVQMAMIAYEAAVYLSRCGRDPGKNLTEAQKHLEHALELNPRQLLPTYYLGLVKVKQAAWRLDKKENPSEFIQPAKQWLEKALAFRPDFDRTYYLQAELALVEARWALFEKRSPAAFFPVADAALEKAAQVKSNSAELYLLKARLQLEQAAWQTAQQQNPQTAISNGLAAVSQALKLNPLATEPLALKGALLQLQAQTLPNPTTTQEAMAILEEGLRKNQWLTFQFRPYLLQAQNQSRKP